MRRRRQSKNPFLTLAGLLLVIIAGTLAVQYAPRVLMGILMTGSTNPATWWTMASDENWATDNTILLGPYGLMLNPDGLECGADRQRLRDAARLPSGSTSEISYREAQIQAALDDGFQGGCFTRSAPATHKGTSPFAGATRTYTPGRLAVNGDAQLFEQRWAQMRSRLSTEAVCGN